MKYIKFIASYLFMIIAAHAFAISPAFKLHLWLSEGIPPCSQTTGLLQLMLLFSSYFIVALNKTNANMLGVIFITTTIFASCFSFGYTQYQSLLLITAILPIVVLAVKSIPSMISKGRVFHLAGFMPIAISFFIVIFLCNAQKPGIERILY